MTTSTISDVITVLTAEQLFCVIKRFPRVWFSLISTNPYVCYEVPVPSEAVSFDHDNGWPTICDRYQCKVDFYDNDIVNLEATPLANGDNEYPNISISVTQYF